MDWKNNKKDGYPPESDDVNVLLKIENTPFKYVAAVWDGERFWVLSPNLYRSAPWTTLPSGIEVTDWCYIK